MWKNNFSYIAVIPLMFQVFSLSYGKTTLSILMPDVQPTKPDTYLCTAVEMTQEGVYLVGFEPQFIKRVVHHILLYGCKQSGVWQADSPNTAWDCGTVGKTKKKTSTPACIGEEVVIYEWSWDAPALKLPEGIGFKVGNDSWIKFLVLNVHYLHVDKFLDGETDRSGLIIETYPGDSKKISKHAGTYVHLTYAYQKLPPKEITHLETACILEEDPDVHIFAFKTHTHQYGQLVSGYVVRSNGTWESIGKGDPRKPQMWYPMEKELTLKKGDIWAARCTYFNTKDYIISTGATSEDEMCNLYIMYYVDADQQPLKSKGCAEYGPPKYSWAIDPKLDPVPKWVNEDASQLLNEI